MFPQTTQYLRASTSAAVYHPGVGTLRRSEDATALAGEAREPGGQDRAIAQEAKIIIEGGPLPAPLPGPASAPASLPRAPARARGGPWLVIFVYVVAASALALAIYERYYA
jgi:hypothetical protein